MDKLNNSKGTPTKRTANNCSNDQNSEFCNYDKMVLVENKEA
ncbi:MAG: hypothetical protein K0R15_2052 [Clostridiales bacterium]|nr:hypothetical protein [Clostridiales bacterium]